MSNEFDTFSEDDFRDLIDEVKAAGQVPEPSPLFWNHLSARVRDAVAAQPIPGPWWVAHWRPLVAAVGSLGLVAFLMLRPHAPTAPVAPPAAGPRDLVADVAVSEMWRMIEVAAPHVEMDSVREAGLMPSPYATDQAIEALTPDQREALVRLLRKEMGVSE
jgi:hypothetical protein